MQVFHDAVDLLYTQTVGRTLTILERFFSETESHGNQGDSSHEHNNLQATLPFDSTTAASVVHEREIEPTIDTPPPSFKRLGDVIGGRVEGEVAPHTVAFVGSAESPLFGTPTKSFDTVITRIPYGSMIMVLEEKGRFSKVAKDGLVGWMLRDDLRARAAHVFPEFVVGEENGHDDPNTLRLRACIKDIFHGGETEVPLQSGEYVLYMLMRKNVQIDWPPTRPRTPGMWHTLLKGAPRVYVGVVPKAGSILEYTLENDTGHLAYVDAVFPDDRISISEVNYPDNGMYSERTLTKDEWQALNPIFIQVS